MASTIEANIPYTNYVTMGAKGKGLLYERQGQAMGLCKKIGTNIPGVKRKFPNIQNKKLLNEYTDTVVDFCSKLPSEQDIQQKGVYVDYILGMTKYYTNIRRSNSPTLELKKNENEPFVSLNNGTSTPQPLSGGRRKTKRSQYKKRRTTRKRKATRKH